jgi:hypothetical protein
MSGIVGHITYALLSHRKSQEHRLSCAAIISQHFDHYLSGAYLGVDIMTLPGGVCPECGQEWGYCASMPKTCPDDGAPLTPYVLNHAGESYPSIDIHRAYYGRTHLIFGWHQDEHLCMTWDDLPEFFGACLADANEPAEKAYVLGFISHVVGDCMIKSFQPGLKLHLLNGTYTPQNRPIQDLYSYHEVGIAELGVDWPSLMESVVATPVQTIQAHYMRCAEPSGTLAEKFPEGWRPELKSLLMSVMAENRRYQRIRNVRLLEELKLKDGPEGPECDAGLSMTAEGLNYREMLSLCRESDFRAALDTIAEETAVMFGSASK